jgi:asparagine synthase (glutamine-hydrolysing)
MSHRGPDQHGVWEGENAGLGHRRLSIIDLSEAGRQPLQNEDGTVQLVFNGEIYNFRALRRRLKSTHRFQSETDSEVLVHGYEAWGIDGLLERIRGMFAFALWDTVRRLLHVARDHVGKKPLYYTTREEGLAFGSTLPALLELLDETPDVSHAAVRAYLTYMCVPAPRSIFEGVHKLPPAHRLTFREGTEPELKRYWRPDFTEKRSLSKEAWLERIESTMMSAVRDRLVADVPLGAFLSGGIDSSMVTALMSKTSEAPPTTVSMGFGEEQFNELPHARRVADTYDTDHHEHVLRPEAAAVLPELTFQYGEPFADPSALATYYLAQATRKHVKVALSGTGGDENFAGYHAVPAMALAEKARMLPGVKSGRIARMLRKLGASGSVARKLRWIAELGKGPEGGYVFDPIGRRTFRGKKEGLLGPALRRSGAPGAEDELYRSLWREAGEVAWTDRVMYVDMMAYLPNDLMAKADVASMAHGLEVRTPLLDVGLIELAAQIPSGVKVKPWRTKHLLKQLAERHLPHDVVHRRKQGFSLPISEWFRGELSELLEAVLLSPSARRRRLFRPAAVRQMIEVHQEGAADHGQRLWMLLNLELWFRMFVDEDVSRNDRLTEAKTNSEQVTVPTDRFARGGTCFAN